MEWVPASSRYLIFPENIRLQTHYREYHQVQPQFTKSIGGYIEVIQENKHYEVRSLGVILQCGSCSQEHQCEELIQRKESVEILVNCTGT